MHDPLTVAFEIRRPWPRSDTWKTKAAADQGIRWETNGAFWVLAGRGVYWPSLITVWHRDPSGYDDVTCGALRGKAWRFHIHHWRIQVAPLQHLRRRLLTRCEVCGGHSVKGHPVNVSTQWDGPSGHWWQGEPGLTHSDCYRVPKTHYRAMADAASDFGVEVD